MTGDADLEDALRRRDRRQWNERALADYLDDPATLKGRADLCAGCEKPCTDVEVCVSVVASELGLLDDLGRRQAMDVVESAVTKLSLRDEARVRRDGERRPNTFVAADGP